MSAPPSSLTYSLTRINYMGFINGLSFLLGMLMLFLTGALTIANSGGYDDPAGTTWRWIKKHFYLYVITLTSWLWAPWVALGIYTAWQVNMNKVIDTGRPYIVEPNAPVRVTEGDHAPIVPEKIETPAKGATAPCPGK